MDVILHFCLYILKIFRHCKFNFPLIIGICAKDCVLLENMKDSVDGDAVLNLRSVQKMQFYGPPVPGLKALCSLKDNVMHKILKTF